MSRDSYTRYARAILWLVPEGDVTIGGPQPAFTVHVEPFYLSKLPVTNLQYEAYDPGHVRSSAAGGDDDPAVGVDFAGARGYCAWYAGVSRKPMRLPSEFEWEYACRGSPNPFGLIGMLGGVWEWTSSLYLPYPAAPGDGRDDPSGSGPRVLRGGSSRVSCREPGCGVRLPAEPELRSDDVGFRVARSFRVG